LSLKVKVLLYVYIQCELLGTHKNVFTKTIYMTYLVYIGYIAIIRC